jgi:hypothetical protein
MNFKNRYFKSEDHKCRSLEEDVSAIECAKGLKIVNNLFCVIDTTMNCEIYNGISQTTSTINIFESTSILG